MASVSVYPIQYDPLSEFMVRIGYKFVQSLIVVTFLLILDFTIAVRFLMIVD